MLGSLDICALFSSEYTDGAGDRRTRDRSRHGLHPVLGDGVTPATFPTWSASRGLYTFDGSDYMVLRATDDVAGVLADMGSIQDEFWMFYMGNAIWTAATHQTLFHKTDVGGETIRLRYTNADVLELHADDGGGGVESLLTTVAQAALTQNREMLITFQRASDVQEIWFNDVLIASDTDASVDASGGGNAFIGAESTPAQYIRNNCGVRYLGYGRGRVTAVYLRQVSRFFRGLL